MVAPPQGWVNDCHDRPHCTDRPLTVVNMPLKRDVKYSNSKSTDEKDCWYLLGSSSHQHQ